MTLTTTKPTPKPARARLAAAVDHIENHMRDAITGRKLVSTSEFADILLDIRGELVRSGRDNRLDAAIAHIEKHMSASLTTRELISTDECADILLDIRGELANVGV